MPVSWMCEALDVPESGYHARAARRPSGARQRQGEPVAAIGVIHAEVRGRHGSPRATAELNARGHERAGNTAAKPMRERGARAKAPKRAARPTDPRHDLPVFESVLDRAFEPGGPNVSWAADVTYIPTGAGWLYLAAVEDLFSRMVVGWSMAETVEGRPVVDAPEVAPARRCPAAGLLAHSDRGSQYASAHYQGASARAGGSCSTSGVGRCWDNAPVGSPLGRLKGEVAPGEMFAARDRARAEVFEHLGVFDNRVRRHSSLGLVPPAEFERTYNQTHP